MDGRMESEDQSRSKSTENKPNKSFWVHSSVNTEHLIAMLKKQRHKSCVYKSSSVEAMVSTSLVKIESQASCVTNHVLRAVNNDIDLDPRKSASFPLMHIEPLDKGVSERFDSEKGELSSHGSNQTSSISRSRITSNAPCQSKFPMRVAKSLKPVTETLSSKLRKNVKRVREKNYDDKSKTARQTSPKCTDKFSNKRIPPVEFSETKPSLSPKLRAIRKTSPMSSLLIGKRFQRHDKKDIQSSAPSELINQVSPENNEATIKFPICRVIKVKHVTPDIVMPDILYGPPIPENRSQKKRTRLKTQLPTTKNVTCSRTRIGTAYSMTEFSSNVRRFVATTSRSSCGLDQRNTIHNSNPVNKSKQLSTTPTIRRSLTTNNSRYRRRRRAQRPLNQAKPSDKKGTPRRHTVNMQTASITSHSNKTKKSCNIQRGSSFFVNNRLLNSKHNLCDNNCGRRLSLVEDDFLNDKDYDDDDDVDDDNESDCYYLSVSDSDEDDQSSSEISGENSPAKSVNFDVDNEDSVKCNDVVEETIHKVVTCTTNSFATDNKCKSKAAVTKQVIQDNVVHTTETKNKDVCLKHNDVDEQLLNLNRGIVSNINEQSLPKSNDMKFEVGESIKNTNDTCSVTGAGIDESCETINVAECVQTKSSNILPAENHDDTVELGSSVVKSDEKLKTTYEIHDNVEVTTVEHSDDMSNVDKEDTNIIESENTKDNGVGPMLGKVYMNSDSKSSDHSTLYECRVQPIECPFYSDASKLEKGSIIHTEEELENVESSIYSPQSACEKLTIDQTRDISKGTTGNEFKHLESEYDNDKIHLTEETSPEKCCNVVSSEDAKAKKLHGNVFSKTNTEFVECKERSRCLNDDTQRFSVRQMVQSLQMKMTSPTRNISPTRIVPPPRRERSDWVKRCDGEQEDAIHSVKTRYSLPNFDTPSSKAETMSPQTPIPRPRKRSNDIMHSENIGIKTGTQKYEHINDAINRSEVTITREKRMVGLISHRTIQNVNYDQPKYMDTKASSAAYSNQTVSDTEKKGTFLSDTISKAKSVLGQMRSRSLSPAKVGLKINSIFDKGKASISSVIKSWSNTEASGQESMSNVNSDENSIVYNIDSLNPSASSVRFSMNHKTDDCVNRSSTISSNIGTLDIHGDTHKPVYCLSIYTPSQRPNQNVSTSVNMHRGSYRGTSDQNTSPQSETIRAYSGDLEKCQNKDDGVMEIDIVENRCTGDTCACDQNEVSTNVSLTNTRSSRLKSILECDSTSISKSDDGRLNGIGGTFYKNNEKGYENPDSSKTGSVSLGFDDFLPIEKDMQQQNPNNPNEIRDNLNDREKFTSGIPTRASLSDCSRDARYVSEHGDESECDNDQNEILKTHSLVNASEAGLSESGLALLSQEASIKRCPSFPDLTDLNDEDEIDILEACGGPSAKESITAIQGLADLELDKDSVQENHGLSIEDKDGNLSDINTQSISEISRNTEDPERVLNHAIETRNLTIESENNYSRGEVSHDHHLQAHDQLLCADKTQLTSLSVLPNKTDEHVPKQSDIKSHECASEYPRSEYKPLDAYPTMTTTADQIVPEAKPTLPVVRSPMKALSNLEGHNNSPQTGINEPVVDVGTIVSLIESCRVLSDSDITPVVVHCSTMSLHASTDDDATLCHVSRGEKKITAEQMQSVESANMLESTVVVDASKLDTELCLPSPPSYNPCEHCNDWQTTPGTSNLNDTDHSNKKDYSSDDLTSKQSEVKSCISEKDKDPPHIFKGDKNITTPDKICDILQTNYEIKDSDITKTKDNESFEIHTILSDTTSVQRENLNKVPPDLTVMENTAPEKLENGRLTNEQCGEQYPINDESEVKESAKVEYYDHPAIGRVNESAANTDDLQGCSNDHESSLSGFPGISANTSGLCTPAAEFQVRDASFTGIPDIPNASVHGESIDDRPLNLLDQLENKCVDDLPQDRPQDNENCELITSNTPDQELDNVKLSFHSKESSTCDLSLTSQSRSYRSFSTDDDTKSSGAGEQLPLVSDAEVNKKKRNKVKRIPSGEGPSHQPDKTIRNGPRASGSSRPLSNSNSPELNVAGGSRTFVPPRSRPPKATLAQRTSSTGAPGGVKKEIKWDDDISGDDLDDMSTQSTSDLTSNKSNSCTPVSGIKGTGTLLNQEKLDPSLIKGSHSNMYKKAHLSPVKVSNSRSNPRSEPTKTKIHNYSYRSKVIKSPPPKHIKNFDVRACLRHKDEHFTCDSISSVDDYQPLRLKLKPIETSGDTHGTKIIKEQGPEQEKKHHLENETSEQSMAEGQKVDENLPCESISELNEDVMSLSGRSARSMSVNNNNGSGDSPSASPLLPQPINSSNSTDFDVSPIKSFRQNDQTISPCSFGHADDLTLGVSDLSSLPCIWNYTPKVIQPHGFVIPNETNPPSLVGTLTSSCSVGDLRTSSHLLSSSIDSLVSNHTKLQNTTYNVRSNRQNLCTLSQRVHKSTKDLHRAYSFVSRSQMHLDRCDLLIERSSEIIRRSEEMLASSRSQMEETARTLNDHIRKRSSVLDIDKVI